MLNGKVGNKQKGCPRSVKKVSFIETDCFTLSRYTSKICKAKKNPDSTLVTILHLDSRSKVILKNLSRSNEGCLKDHFIQQVRKTTINRLHLQTSFLGSCLRPKRLRAGAVSGEFILRCGDGSSVLEGSQRKPQQVAAGDQCTSLSTPFRISSLQRCCHYLRVRCLRRMHSLQQQLAHKRFCMVTAAVVQCIFLKGQESR